MYFALVMTFLENALYDIRDRLENILRELAILNPEEDDSDSDDDDEPPSQMYT